MPTINSNTEKQWHAVRSQGIGASEIAAALGCSRYQTPRQLWSRKVGIPCAERETTDRMRWGNIMEPIAARWLAQAWGVQVRQPERYAVEVHPEHSWMRATLDARVTVDLVATCDAPHGEYVVDFKIVHPFDREWRDQQAPDDYLAQIGQQMLVTGTPRGLLVAIPFAERVPMVDATDADWATLAGFVAQIADAFDPGHALALLGCSEPFVRRFDADPRLDAAIIQRGGDFWRRILASRQILADHGGEWSDEVREALRPYEPAAQPADMGDMRAQFQAPTAEAIEIERKLADDLRTAKASSAAASDAYDALKATLVQRLGNMSRATCEGELVATYNATTRGRRLEIK